MLEDVISENGEIDTRVYLDFILVSFTWHVFFSDMESLKISRDERGEIFAEHLSKFHLFVGDLGTETCPAECKKMTSIISVKMNEFDAGKEDIIIVRIYHIHCNFDRFRSHNEKIIFGTSKNLIA